jgi:hypothetical protein
MHALQNHIRTELALTLTTCHIWQTKNSQQNLFKTKIGSFEGNILLDGDIFSWDHTAPIAD